MYRTAILLHTFPRSFSLKIIDILIKMAWCLRSITHTYRKGPITTAIWLQSVEASIKSNNPTMQRRYQLDQIDGQICLFLARKLPLFCGSDVWCPHWPTIIDGGIVRTTNSSGVKSSPCRTAPVFHSPVHHVKTMKYFIMMLMVSRGA